MTQAAAIQLHKKRISPARLVEVAYVPFKNQFAERHIAADFNIPYTLPDVECDIAKTAWVLTIFFSNAVRYTPEWGKLQVRGTNKENRLTLSVQNSGYGIPPEKVHAMFDALAEGVDAPEYGRSLALLLAREIIEAHGGKIGAYSEPGELSRFFIEMPIE